MKYREAILALFIFALTLLGLTGLVAGDQALYGAKALHAQSVGFEALAHQVFGSRACAGGAQGNAIGVE